MPLHCVWAFKETQPEAQALQVWILLKWDQQFGSSCLQGGCTTQQREPKSCGWICSTPNLHGNQSLFGLGGALPQFIKGFTCIARPLHKHLSVKSASKKNEWLPLTEEVLGAFEMFQKACLEAPALALADFNKPFLLETNASKLGLGALLSQKQTDGQYHLVAYASQSLTVHEHNYHSTKKEFLALKWAIAEQFQEYLLWKPSPTSWLHLI